jgi:hypothetical protein
MRGRGLIYVTLLVGCGPVQYGLQVTTKSTAAVEAARTSGAEKLAPYEFTAAEQMLHKAREEMAFSNYQNALHYGREAEKHAVKAAQLANERGGAKAAKEVLPDAKKPHIDDKKPIKLVPDNPDAPPPGAEENPRPPTP